MQDGGPTRQWGISVKTQQRVEPQQTAAMPAQPVQLMRQFRRLAGIQPVGDQQHHGAPAHQTARVLAAQRGQRLAELGAACEVLYGQTGASQHLVGIGDAHRRRQVGQTGAERKHVALAQAVGSAMQKSQQQARVALHRTRHVHQHQQRQRLMAPLQTRQRQQLATGTRGLVHDTWPIHARSPFPRAHTARGKLGHRQADVAGQPLDQAVFAA